MFPGFTSFLFSFGMQLHTRGYWAQANVLLTPRLQTNHCLQQPLQSWKWTRGDCRGYLLFEFGYFKQNKSSKRKVTALSVVCVRDSMWGKCIGYSLKRRIANEYSFRNGTVRGSNVIQGDLDFLSLSSLFAVADETLSSALDSLLIPGLRWGSLLLAQWLHDVVETGDEKSAIPNRTDFFPHHRKTIQNLVFEQEMWRWLSGGFKSLQKKVSLELNLPTIFILLHDPRRRPRDF